MKYIAALDVGTTTIRCHILDSNAVTIASATEKVFYINNFIHLFKLHFL